MSGSVDKRRFHDRIVWSLWCHYQDNGQPAMFEAAVPSGRVDLMIFSADGKTPRELVEIKIGPKTIARGPAQLVRYGEGLVSAGYPSPKLTLVMPADEWSREIRRMACEHQVSVIRVKDFHALLREAPYRPIRTEIDVHWPAGGWTNYWAYWAERRVAA